MAVRVMGKRTKYCPHCNRIYDVETISGSALKPRETKYGSPLRICPHCKKVFLDREYHEIAIEGPQRADMVRVSPYGCVCCAFGVGMGIIMFGAGLALVGCLFIGLGAYSYYSEASTYAERQQRVIREAEASEERLKNPAYAAILKRLGYPVPDRYLAPVQQDGEGEQNEISGVGQNRQPERCFK